MHLFMIKRSLIVYIIFVEEFIKEDCFYQTMALEALLDWNASPVLQWLRNTPKAQSAVNFSPRSRGEAIDETVILFTSTDKKDYSAAENAAHFLRGYGLPTLGAIGGYMVTKNLGGASAGMMMTSFGMTILENSVQQQQCPQRTIAGYRAGVVLGAVSGILYLLSYNQHQ